MLKRKKLFLSYGILLIKLFGDRIEKLKDQIQTEEATKNAFIMPFIKALGYDVFNPFEVMPEFVAISE